VSRVRVGPTSVPAAMSADLLAARAAVLRCWVAAQRAAVDAVDAVVAAGSRVAEDAGLVEQTSERVWERLSQL